jgi:hypothetical protein
MGLRVFNPSSAIAAIRQLEEAPGQMVYQSRQTLKDQHGNSWQAIAFKRIRPDGQTNVDLRLVGFPGVVAIDHTQSLILTNSLGKVLTAADTSSHIFTQSNHVESNVGQYDLQPLLSELQPELPLQLTIAMMNSEPVTLSITPALVQEWQMVAGYEESVTHLDWDAVQGWNPCVGNLHILCLNLNA